MVALRIDRIISLIFAFIGLTAIAMYSNAAGQVLFVTFVLLLGPLTLIWFGDEIGCCGGAAGRFHKDSPGWLVKFFGWSFLVALTAALICAWAHRVIPFS